MVTPGQQDFRMTFDRASIASRVLESSPGAHESDEIVRTKIIW